VVNWPLFHPHPALSPQKGEGVMDFEQNSLIFRKIFFGVSRFLFEKNVTF
jgi:hypothetical protein